MFKGESQDERFKAINDEKTLSHELGTLFLAILNNKTIKLGVKRFRQSIHDSNHTITTQFFETMVNSVDNVFFIDARRRTLSENERKSPVAES